MLFDTDNNISMNYIIIAFNKIQISTPKLKENRLTHLECLAKIIFVLGTLSSPGMKFHIMKGMVSISMLFVNISRNGLIKKKIYC